MVSLKNLNSLSLVISCKNLIPCDSNGLRYLHNFHNSQIIYSVFSDPYVEIQLCPNFLYPHIEKQQTSIVKKTLNPMFNEIFEL